MRSRGRTGRCRRRMTGQRGHLVRAEHPGASAERRLHLRVLQAGIAARDDQHDPFGCSHRQRLGDPGRGDIQRRRRLGDSGGAASMIDDREVQRMFGRKL